MIRKARVDDIINCLELLKEFQRESLGEYGFEVDIEQAQELVRQYVETSFIVELGGKIVGLLAGFITIFPLDNSRIFHEIAWYVSKPHRMTGVKLLKYVEDYCRKENIQHIVMVHMANLKSKKLGDFYTRMGYRALETHYIKPVR